jgi:hypothetical protein
MAQRPAPGLGRRRPEARRPPTLGWPPATRRRRQPRGLRRRVTVLKWSVPGPPRIRPVRAALQPTNQPTIDRHRKSVPRQPSRQAATMRRRSTSRRSGPSQDRMRPPIGTRAANEPLLGPRSSKACGIAVSRRLRGALS